MPIIILHMLPSFASLKKGTNIIIVVVDLREDNVIIESTSHYWLSFIQHQKFLGKVSYVVIGSHFDTLTSDMVSIAEKNEVLQKVCASIVPNAKYFMLDCRDPGSNQLDMLKKKTYL